MKHAIGIIAGVLGMLAASLANTDLKSALHEALLDEFKAEATYQAAILKFGEVRPFSNIVRADVLSVFKKLQSDSKTKHMPAFSRSMGQKPSF
jgi:hypothetical protein